jgi:hypothetical protein
MKNHTHGLLAASISASGCTKASLLDRRENGERYEVCEEARAGRQPRATEPRGKPSTSSTH